MWELITSLNATVISIVAMLIGIVLLIVADKIGNSGLAFFAILLLTVPMIFLMWRGGKKVGGED